MEKRRKAAKEKKTQLKQQAAMKRLGLGSMGMRAIYEMITAPETFEKFNEGAIIQDGSYHDNLVKDITNKTDSLVGDSKKQEYLLSKGADLTKRFQYLARITNNSRMLQKNTGKRLEQPIPAEIDLRGVGRGFTIASILQTQVEAAIAEGNTIKKVSETLKKKYARFDQGTGNGQASTAGGPPPVYASRGMMIPRGTDTVPAMLTPGEFVVNRRAAQANMPLLNSINSGVQYLSDGGGVGGGLFNGFSGILSSVTKSVADFGSIIQQAAQAAQGTAGGEAGGVNTNGIAQFTQNFDNFITQLQAITFPEVINIQGTVTANVNVAGGDAFANLAQESINSIVNRQLYQAFNALEQQSEGQIQNPIKN